MVGGDIDSRILVWRCCCGNARSPVDACSCIEVKVESRLCWRGCAHCGDAAECIKSMFEMVGRLKCYYDTYSWVGAEGGAAAGKQLDR